MNIPIGIDDLPKAPRKRLGSKRAYHHIDFVPVLHSFLASGREREVEHDRSPQSRAPSLLTLETEEAAQAKPLDLLP